MKRLSCLRIPILALGLTVVWAELAAPVALADRNAEARVFFEEGNQQLTRALRMRGARRRRLLEDALESFVSSLRIVRSRNAVFNAGVTLQELERHDEAFGYYMEYLAMPHLAEEDRVAGTQRLDALRPHVAALEITSEPTGAEVRVDRADLAPRGTTPLVIAVSEGEHQIFMSLPGYREAQITSRASLGQRAALTARLEPIPVPVVIRAPEGGTLSIDGMNVAPGAEISLMPGPHTIRYEPAMVRQIEIRPGQERFVLDLRGAGNAPRMGEGTLHVAANTEVTVSVDGLEVGRGREVQAALPGGRHVVEATAPGRAPARSEVTIPPDTTVQVRLEMVPSMEGATTLGALPVATWIVGGIVGATGLVMGGLALDARSTFDADSTEQNADAVDDANLLADSFFIAAGVIGIVALVLTLVNDDVEQAPSRFTISGAPLPDGVYVQAEIPWGTP